MNIVKRTIQHKKWWNIIQEYQPKFVSTNQYLHIRSHEVTFVLNKLQIYMVFNHIQIIEKVSIYLIILFNLKTFGGRNKIIGRINLTKHVQAVKKYIINP